MRAGWLLCLAACATGQGSARDDDDARLGHEADLRRDRVPGEADAAEGEPRPASSPQPEPKPEPKPSKRGDADAAGQAAAAAAVQAAMKVHEGQLRAEQECRALADRPLALSEEASVGRALAATVVASSKGAWLDPLEVTDPEALDKKLSKNPGGFTLPKGDKNDVTRWVQVVGASLAAGSTRPGIAWTFGVIEDPAEAVRAVMGGYVFVTTGLIAVLENEAQLAAVMAHAVARIALKQPVDEYVKARHTACRIGLTGYYLMEAGSTDIPGGADFVNASKYGKTMKALATVGVDFDKSPEVDAQFLRWYLERVQDAQRLTLPLPELEIRADAEAVTLLASAGYDSGALTVALERISRLKNRARIEALEKLRGKGGFGSSGGKTPAYPKGLKLPR